MVLKAASLTSLCLCDVLVKGWFESVGCLVGCGCGCLRESCSVIVELSQLAQGWVVVAGVWEPPFFLFVG